MTVKPTLTSDFAFNHRHMLFNVFIHVKACAWCGRVHDCCFEHGIHEIQCTAAQRWAISTCTHCDVTECLPVCLVGTTTMCKDRLTVSMSVCNFQSWSEGLALYLIWFTGINLINIKLWMLGFLSCFSEVKSFNFQSWKSILLFKLQIEVSSWINFKL